MYGVRVCVDPSFMDRQSPESQTRTLPSPSLFPPLLLSSPALLPLLVPSSPFCVDPSGSQMGLAVVLVLVVVVEIELVDVELVVVALLVSLPLSSLSIPPSLPLSLFLSLSHPTFLFSLSLSVTRLTYGFVSNSGEATGAFLGNVIQSREETRHT
jgi:hypothetical protein